MRNLPTSIKLTLLSWTKPFNKLYKKKEPHLVILAYHRVGSGTDVFMDIPVPIFEAQLDYLQDNYEILSLDDAIKKFQTDNLQDDIAVLTFDDGYYDFYTNALPVLEKRNLPCTLFLTTYFVENHQKFPFDKKFCSEKWAHVRPLTWDELKSIVGINLVTIGSHTHTHPRIDRISDIDLKWEIETSCSLIQKRLGVRPIHFACPKGIGSRHIPLIAPNYFKTVSFLGWRPNLVDSVDFYNLFRIPAIPVSDMSLFAHSLTGFCWFLDSLSRAWNLWKR